MLIADCCGDANRHFQPFSNLFAFYLSLQRRNRRGACPFEFLSCPLAVRQYLHGWQSTTAEILFIFCAFLFVLTHPFSPAWRRFFLQATELDHWECMGQVLFTPPPPTFAFFAEHNCWNWPYGHPVIGFGNAIRGVWTAAALALTFGRPLIMTHPPFQRLFLQPVTVLTIYSEEVVDFVCFTWIFFPGYNHVGFRPRLTLVQPIP